MNSKLVLIIGSISVIILIILWQFKIIEEPIAALGAAILTFIGYLFTNDKSSNITQHHSGKGDNVAGNKVINKGK